MIEPESFAAVVLPHGTTTVMIDPHEIANVVGLRGVAYMLEASAELPLRVLVQAPSCCRLSRLVTSTCVVQARLSGPE